MTEIEFENNDFSSVMLNRHSVRHFDKSCKIDRSVLTKWSKKPQQLRHHVICKHGTL